MREKRDAPEGQSFSTRSEIRTAGKHSPSPPLKLGVVLFLFFFLRVVSKELVCTSGATWLSTERRGGGEEPRLLFLLLRKFIARCRALFPHHSHALAPPYSTPNPQTHLRSTLSQPQALGEGRSWCLSTRALEEGEEETEKRYTVNRHRFCEEK